MADELADLRRVAAVRQPPLALCCLVRGVVVPEHDVVVTGPIPTQLSPTTIGARAEARRTGTR
ncbi:MAG: hypothetical protein KatS3mg038_2078 [Candidatus Kapaibacterium sp.]|nr:MAG: hypothetical protein KatS3mg038_2078 [Candidatus Kapabacteria bacterium]